MYVSQILLVTSSLWILSAFLVASSYLAETAISDSFLTLTTDDELGCEEEVIDTKACSMADTWTQVADNL